MGGDLGVILDGFLRQGFLAVFVGLLSLVVSLGASFVLVVGNSPMGVSGGLRVYFGVVICLGWSVLCVVGWFFLIFVVNFLEILLLWNGNNVCPVSVVVPLIIFFESKC